VRERDRQGKTVQKGGPQAPNGTKLLNGHIKCPNQVWYSTTNQPEKKQPDSDNLRRKQQQARGVIVKHRGEPVGKARATAEKKKDTSPGGGNRGRTTRFGEIDGGNLWTPRRLKKLLVLGKIISPWNDNSNTGHLLISKKNSGWQIKLGPLTRRKNRGLGQRCQRKNQINKKWN